MVWVNPPNRVNYTGISRVRNVRRYASPKCSTAIALRCFEKNERWYNQNRSAARYITSGAHKVTRPTSRTVLAVATEDVRLYTLFLLLEP